MVDERTTGSSDPPTNQNCVKNDTDKNQIYNWRIAHTTTATTYNNWFTTIYTLEIR